MANLDFSQIRGVAIPDGNVVRIELDGVLVWKAGPTNRVPVSISEDGSVYNGTGYKAGTRVRSGGEEAQNYGASCTGFIRVSGGDVVRLSGWNFAAASSANAINVSDEGFVNLGQVTTQPAHYGVLTAANSPITEDGGVYTYVVPSGLGIAYIRVTGFSETDADGPGAQMFVTINEEM